MTTLPPGSAFRQELIRRIETAPLDRTWHPMVHEEGDRLQVEVTAVHPRATASVELELEAFVGGGFAGQVYRARLVSIQGEIPGLEPDGTYAVKVLRPPSRFSLKFRNLLYWLAYQGAFSAQVDRAAVRAGALWQRLIRRGAALEFGTEQVIVDNYGHFFDERLQSMAEISEWVPGRTWMLEIDDQLFQRRRLRPWEWASFREDVPSPEYLNKRAFMARLVRLFHRMGAPELARQYEWWSMKSQPNALKRLAAGKGPAEGLTAIDFRAGLALLCCLPMSPVDFRLAWQGLRRGNLVQFDRGDTGRLRAFMQEHQDHFADLQPLLDELEDLEHDYRSSLPDITHHGLRLVTDRELRGRVREGRIRDWEALGKVDRPHAERLRRSAPLFVVVLLMGLVPFLRRFWGDARWRGHVLRCLTRPTYLLTNLQVHRIQKLLVWNRAERISDERTLSLVERPLAYAGHLLFLSWMPAGLHYYLSEPDLLWERIRYAVTYPIKLYFKPEVREEWLRDQVQLARDEGMLDEEEEQRILGSIDDPFIQTYLKCVAVHACTLPVTQVVAVLIAAYYYFFHAQSWQEGVVTAGLILAFFQGTPISPGSLTRGFYVVYRMIRDRNIKDYWIAALISFWHYVGYLGFPVQMVARFPGLARFMGGSWATRAARIIPVFGEKGALVEHFVFDTFFNLPISFKAALLRRRRRRLVDAKES